MRAPLIHGAVQAVALGALVAGIYLLAGLAWAVTVAGGAVFLVSVLAELGSGLGAASSGRASREAA